MWRSKLFAVMCLSQLRVAQALFRSVSLALHWSFHALHTALALLLSSQNLTYI